MNGNDLGTTQLMSVPYALYAKSAGSGVFEKDNANIRLSGGHDSLSFLFGSPQMNDDGDPLHDSLMFFNKTKEAFRVGKTYSAFWNVDSLGLGSFATGLNTRATANYSTALGYWTIASNSYTTAAGYYSEATGDKSTAIGNTCIASGISSVAMGESTRASSTSSTALGSNTTASGIYSVAMGRHSTASGNNSTAMGIYTDASGNSSTALGAYTIAAGDYSTALGRLNTSGNHLFVIGNGTSGVNRLNAMQISQSTNNAYFRGSVSPLIDNAVSLGASFQRWTSVYATNGTIQTSDTTLKTNIKSLSYGLKDLMKIKTISYQWKNDKHNITKIGFNAQNLLKVIPEVVQTHSEQSNYDTGEVSYKKNKKLGVFYSDMIPVLTKSIQEQQVIIQNQEKELKTQREEFDSKLNKMQEQLNMLLEQNKQFLVKKRK